MSPVRSPSPKLMNVAEFVASQSTPATKNVENMVVTDNLFISTKKVSFSTETCSDNLTQVL